MKEKYKAALEAILKLSAELEQQKKENADLQSQLDIANALAGKCQSCLVVKLLGDEITALRKTVVTLEPTNIDQLLSNIHYN